jgi:hypothetical protein
MVQLVKSLAERNHVESKRNYYFNLNGVDSIQLNTNNSCISPYKGDFFRKVVVNNREPGSSVSIVSGYGLDDRAIDVRSPATAKGFLL